MRILCFSSSDHGQAGSAAAALDRQKAEGPAFAAAQDFHGGEFAHAPVIEEPQKIIDAGDTLLVDGDDEVARQDARLRRRTVLLHIHDAYAGGL